LSASALGREAQSANEELQSVNEQLETSKEELQASNEELVTVNAELQHRNQELDRAREFARSVTESVRDPLLVLDGKLRVKSASRPFYQTFGARPEETLQRHWCELGTGEWDVPALKSALEDVVLHDKAFDGFEVRTDIAGLGRRIILIYARRVRPEPGRQVLVLVSIEDITDRYALQDSQQNLALMAKSERRKVDEFLSMLAYELRNPLGPLRTGLQVLQHPVWMPRAACRCAR
jgi:two-component system CheB/CheR fusion protein